MSGFIKFIIATVANGAYPPLYKLTRAVGGGATFWPFFAS